MSDIKKWDEINGAAAPPEHLAAFLTSDADSYAILQLRHTEETRHLRFEPYAGLQRQGEEPDMGRYEAVYHGALPAPLITPEAAAVALEEVFWQFNANRPEDFAGHCLSVSDIVALRVDGVVSCHYVDSIGFKELDNFPLRENYLKNAEMAVEDDYNSIDGIINNGRKDESAERPSVLEDLRHRTAGSPPEWKPPCRQVRQEER